VWEECGGSVRERSVGGVYEREECMGERERERERGREGEREKCVRVHLLSVHLLSVHLLSAHLLPCASRLLTLLTTRKRQRRKFQGVAPSPSALFATSGYR
jgi:hypothetical protein